MYEEITRQQFKDRMEELILITKTNALYAIDMIYPLLETNQDAKALSYIKGQGALMDTLFILQNNMDILLKDNLVPEDTDLIYFIDEFGMPSKTNPEQYELIISGEDRQLIDDEEIPYEDVEDNPDNERMFA